MSGPQSQHGVSSDGADHDRAADDNTLPFGIKIDYNMSRKFPFAFDISRKLQGLSPTTNLFFTPYDGVSDALQQWKTAPVSLVIGLIGMFNVFISLIIDISLLLLSIPCVSPELFLQSGVNIIGDLGAMVVFPVAALVVAVSSVISLVTRPIGSIFPDAGKVIDKAIGTQTFVDSLPDLGTEIKPLDISAQPLKTVLYTFDFYRSLHHLSPSTNLFFKPYESFFDALQQWKTAPVSLVIGVDSLCKSLLYLASNICLLALSIPCVSPDLFMRSMIAILSDIERMVVVPVTACLVAAGSLISLFTRPIGTVFPDVGKAIDEAIGTQHLVDGMAKCGFKAPT